MGTPDEVRAGGGRGGLALLGAISFVVAWLAWSASETTGRTPVAVNLRAPGEAGPPAGEPAAEGGALRVAIAPVISPERSLSAHELLVAWLSHRVGRAPVLLRRPSYAEVNELVRSRQADLALVCTNAYVQGERDFGMRLVAAPQVRGRTTYQAVFIVPAGGTAQSLLDLRGGRFAYVDVMSTTGWLYPRAWLRARGEVPEAFFAKTYIAGAHDHAVRAVARGQADGASVDALVLDALRADAPDLAAEVRELHRSEPFGMPPVVAAPGLPDGLEAALRAALLEMHLDPAGRTALAAVGIERFVPARPEDYESVRRLSAEEGGRR